MYPVRKRRSLSRRAMLRSLGGAAIALPMLEIMLDSKEAAAAPPPLRYLVLWGGQSMGADGDPVDNYFVPDATGPGYDLKVATQPFADLNVQDEITIISGLRIPTANGGTVPAGGRPDDFHINNMGPLLTGMRSLDHDKRGPTSDQIVSEVIAGNTVHQNLVYQIQAAWYLSVSAPYGRDVISIKDDGSGGLIEVPGTVSPSQAFDSLFYNFAPPDDEAAAAEQDFLWRQRKSVLDLVKNRADVLRQKLGGADRERLDRHFDEIRELEKRISTLPPAPGGECQKFGAPSDPALGGNQPDGGYDQNVGYSGEEERARVFMDLVHMAFTCDLSRVGAVLFTMAQSHLNMNALTGQATDLHEVGHGGVPGGTMAVATAQAWHMKHFAYLVDKLRGTPEGTGNLLDSCGIVWLWEGGHGNDPSTGNESSSHSTENMVMCVAGGAGGLRRGEHIAAAGAHPGQAILTVMNAVGVAGDVFGEVNGNLPALIG
jgi:hypothetical protein